MHNALVISLFRFLIPTQIQCFLKCLKSWERAGHDLNKIRLMWNFHVNFKKLSILNI